MRKIAAILSILALIAAPARSDDAAPPKPSAAEIAALKARNQEIVAQNKDADGVFTVRDDGSIKHLQSGLMCPAFYPNVTLYQLVVYPKAGKGLDVGCDYRRADDKGGANAKLTIFAVKASDGDSVDSAFAGYRGAIVENFEDLRSQGPALRIQEDGKKSTLPPIRSEEFLVRLNNRDYTTQLVVALSKGWIIEIRATFTGLPNVIVIDKGSTVQDGVDAAGDRAMFAKALFDALGTIGQ